MRQHPIPQNVTTYKFRLVGNWTLRQFLLFMLGIGLAIAIYFTNLYGPIKWLLIFTAFAFGAALAFIPIQERPLDQWIIAYIRAIYSPTQFIWRKNPTTPDFFTFHPKSDLIPEQTQEMINTAIQRKKAGLTSFIQTLPEQQISAKLNQFESHRLDYIDQLFTPMSPSHSTHPPTPPPPPPTTPTPSPEPTLTPSPPPLPSAPITGLIYQSTETQSPTPSASDKAVSTTPNTLTGTIFSSDRTPLENALIEIRDSQNLPVRATKTNSRGEFISTTPLENGRYQVLIEAPGYSFDILNLELTGQPIKPLQIIAKPS